MKNSLFFNLTKPEIMRKIIYLFWCVFSSIVMVNAQSADAFKYQAMIRDASGNLFHSTNTTIQVKIKEGSSSGLVKFEENHSNVIVEKGLFSISIGEGQNSQGKIGELDFGKKNYFLEVGVRFPGSSSLEVLPATQIFGTTKSIFANRSDFSEKAKVAETSEDWIREGNASISSRANIVTIGRAVSDAVLDVNGITKTNCLEISGGCDFAEGFDVSSEENESIEPGTLVSIDPNNPGKLMITNSAYDKKVVGIISGANGINPGMLMGQKGSVADGEYPVALSGRVYVKADASFGAIKPGDMLTSSVIPGYAMKIKKQAKAQGAIIGKAMSGLDGGTGYVLVLVSLL
jgi:hypothetical protein